VPSVDELHCVSIKAFIVLRRVEVRLLVFVSRRLLERALSSAVDSRIKDSLLTGLQCSWLRAILYCQIFCTA